MVMGLKLKCHDTQGVPYVDPQLVDLLCGPCTFNEYNEKV